PCPTSSWRDREWRRSRPRRARSVDAVPARAPAQCVAEMMEPYKDLRGVLPRDGCREKLMRGRDDALAHVVQRAREEGTGRFGVSAAAELTSERIDVHFAGAAKGHFHLAVTEISKEQRHARSGHRSRMLDDAVQVFLPDVVLLERTCVHR